MDQPILNVCWTNCGHGGPQYWTNILAQHIEQTLLNTNIGPILAQQCTNTGTILKQYRANVGSMLDERWIQRRINVGSTLDATLDER